jgi:photosystem II stability/assembly factor-like uncharacterized protein
MKKIYLLFITLLAGGIMGYLYFYTTNLNNSLLSDSLTPKQIWENQRRERKEKGESDKTDKPDEYTKYFKAITTKFGEKDNSYPLNYRINEFSNAKTKLKGLKTNTKFSTIWEERGPANVGGRTRGLIVDPDDASHNTWFAGAATGGIWKTTDGGQTWTCLTDDIPNLSANTLAMAESNRQIIYAGTGESFPGGTYLQGSGIFKSIDKGVNWTQLVNTITEDFEYVNRLVVDPTNADIVVVATESGIMKTTDGGTIWTKVYSSTKGIEDLDADPSNFNNLYGTEHAVGVVKSTDAGDNWTKSIDGLEQGLRYELAISPVNSSKVYLSINTSSTPVVYRSDDAGITWVKFKKSTFGTDDYLGGQGEYDNIITAHPYDEDVAFLGGVNLWKVDFSDPGTTEVSSSFLNRVDLINTESFLSFINFGGTYLDGGMETGDKNGATDLTSTDWASVEIQFGPGKSQKAHRFTVGGVGSGVPVSDYIYQDYVDIPFEVWDITNNKQLMVSFRDQEEDNIFNLITRDPNDDTKGREYLFVNAVEYSATASADIAKNGGHAYKQLYFFWPTLAEGGIWNDASLPDSKISIIYSTVNMQVGASAKVSDAYGSGDNTYDQNAGFGETSIPGLHPDHHNLVIVPINEATDSFLIVNANDGGLAISKNSGIIFNQLPKNYITTQFYGVAKRPLKDEYIGGMQDNGTWRSPADENASSSTNYLFQIGGDGFECIWNNANDQKIIGSVYNNSFRKTENGGANWGIANSGITSGDGPFISRLSTHKNTPDNLYAVGANGVYKSTNFGTSWTMKAIGTGWLQTGRTEVTSQHNVEVSLANKNIIWAGAAMSEANGWKIFVSEDQGETFNSVNDFADADLSGFISGIATHPYEDSTAFLLFSLAGEPKVIRTKDLGQTWEDLSGFVGNTSSDNGFPDVVTHCLVVLPNDPSTIWVGTDIGLFESNDDGTTWHYANNGIPAVSVYDMFIQDGQVVIATHGRGIWTATIEELNYYPELTANYEGFQTINVDVSLISATDSVKIYVNNEFSSLEETIVSGLNSFEVPVTTEGNYKIQVKSYKTGAEYSSANVYTSVDFSPVIAVTKVTDENSIEFTSTFVENYDSVQLFVNSIYKTSELSPSTDFNQIVSLTETGSYTCYINAYMDGDAYKSNEVELNFTYTGLSFVDQVNDLKVYPNPTTGFITIDLPNNFNNTYDVHVYSLSGVQVYTENISKSNNKMNLTKLKEGLYIIRLENKGEIYSQKIQLRR